MLLQIVFIFTKNDFFCRRRHKLISRLLCVSEQQLQFSVEQLFREIVPLNELPVAFVHDQVHIRRLVCEHRHPQDGHPVVRGLQSAEQSTVTDEQSGLVVP